MYEKIKNKKGFTIIEIMVVIALVGILAAVLVPQFGGVRNRAKDAGMLANAKMVEAFVASEIDSWKASEAIGGTAGTDDMIAAIVNHFTDYPLTNPYTGAEDEDNVEVSTTAGTGYKTGGSAGITYVEIENTEPLTVYINGFDAKDKEIKATRREISK